jgi:hypothetical protein
MKLNRSLFLSLGLLVLAASLYRVWDGRPFGFAPQIAIAVFSGAVIKNKKWSFLLPLVSMFLSDALYQLLYVNGFSKIPGFYEGQVSNYMLFTALTVFGFMVRSFNWKNIFIASVSAPTAYFLVSNLMVWMAGAGYARPKTFSGLIATYADGLPFYGYSILGTLFFSGVFFGCYYMVTKKQSKHAFVSI